MAWWFVSSLLVLQALQVQAGDDSAVTIHRDRVLRLARSDDPQTLDPARATMTADIVLLRLIHLPLLELVDGTRVTNGAAIRWSVSEDARTYTFTLDPNVRFSNGRQVTAADYKYALERSLDPKTGCPVADQILSAIAGAKAFLAARSQESSNAVQRLGRWIEPAQLCGIEASDPATLVIHLDQPDPTMPYSMANQFGMPLAREEVEAPGARKHAQVVGSGPYVVQEWVRGVRLVLGPNPCYGGRDPKHFDRVEIMLGGDPSTHVMMFEKGELDLAGIDATLPSSDYHRLGRAPRWRSCLVKERIPGTIYLYLNTQMAPLDNRKVRQALNYAVDKVRRLNCADGRWEPARGVIPPFMPAYNSNLVGYPYDPNKARALLAESSLPSPIRVTLWHPTDPDRSYIAQGVQDDLRAVGVYAELKAVTLGEMTSAARRTNTVQMFLAGWTSPFAEPRDMLIADFKETFYHNNEVNRLVDQAATNIAKEARWALYRRAEEIIVNDAPAVFLGHHTTQTLKQPWLKGPLIEPLWPLRLDRVWIER